jgi:DNA-binding FadR family transcriptional regulator
MKEHEVSRTTVREAVRTLLAKKLIAARPNVGTWVRETNQWNLLDPELLSWLGDTPLGKEIVRDARSFAELLRSTPDMSGNPFVAQALSALTGLNV